jgi:hypothetical protein
MAKFLLSFLLTLSSLMASSVVEQLNDTTQTIQGYFSHYADENLDWVYLTPDGKYIAKVEESYGESINWTWIHEGFSEVRIDLLADGGLIAFGENTQKVASSAVEKLALHRLFVDGLFVHYGTGGLDWVYVTSDGGFVAKLNGLNKDIFAWEWIQGVGANSFESVAVDLQNNTIDFVAKKETTAPTTQECVPYLDKSFDTFESTSEVAFSSIAHFVVVDFNLLEEDDSSAIRFSFDADGGVVISGEDVMNSEAGLFLLEGTYKYEDNQMVISLEYSELAKTTPFGQKVLANANELVIQSQSNSFKKGAFVCINGYAFFVSSLIDTNSL